MEPIVKCLSLHAPWSTLWPRGFKRYETRDWELRHHRGWLAVHAAKYWTADYRDLCLEDPFWAALFGDMCHSRGEALQRPELWPVRGAITGLVNVDLCVKTTDPMLQVYLSTHPNERRFGNFDPGRFAFRAAEHREFVDPIPYKGQQGVFNLPHDLAESLTTRPFYANNIP